MLCLKFAAQKIYLHEPFKLTLQDQTLWLSPERCIYWEEERALILSDLHFGKTGHFRKAGIAVPQDVFKEDLHRLFSQVQHFNAERLLIVGDLFHSVANKEMDLFLKWRKDLSSIAMQLIKGNHDILGEKWYSAADISMVKQKLRVNNFCFTHDINESCNNDDENKDIFTFSGHIHPGIRIHGSGKQTIHLPCFYFNHKYAVLPAFSKFTGIFHIEPKAGDRVFALVDNTIMEI